MKIVLNEEFSLPGAGDSTVVPALFVFLLTIFLRSLLIFQYDTGKAEFVRETPNQVNIVKHVKFENNP